MSDFLQNIFDAQGENRWKIAQTSVKERIAKLLKLRKVIEARQQEFYDAVWADFHKPKTEAWLTEVYPALQEIDHTVNHLPAWVEDKDGSWSFLFPLNSSVSHFEPKGRVLIMAPWNYPFLLFISPIVAAIAAGNVVIAKPSHKTPHVAEVLESIIKEVFPQNEVAVMQGAGAEIGDQLLALPFDHVFFTGSPNVGAHVAEEAAKIHAGVTLELGGKSPVIILDDVKIKDAAKKLAWGKCLNAGQTCIAPDYILIHEDVKEAFIKEFATQVKKLHGKEIKESQHFVRLVTDKAFERVKSYLQDGDIVYGGRTDSNTRFIEPTLLDNVKPDAPVMTEEIFGPIFPMITISPQNGRFKDQVAEFITGREKPLAFYYFGSESDGWELIHRTSSGGGCINDTIMHIANGNVPFGGVGNSGMGRYHGKLSFDAFTHERSIIKAPTWIDLPFRYMPYRFFALIKRMM